MLSEEKKVKLRINCGNCVTNNSGKYCVTRHSGYFCICISYCERIS